MVQFTPRVWSHAYKIKAVQVLHCLNYLDVAKVEAFKEFYHVYY